VNSTGTDRPTGRSLTIPKSGNTTWAVQAFASVR
jgi:hypothetical protein